jgi:hypothetical protein
MKTAVVASLAATAAGAIVGCRPATKPGNQGKTPPGAPTRTTPGPAVASEAKGDESVSEQVTALPESIRYGFRHDPMKWVDESGSLQAALVRKHVFGRARPGDEELFAERIGAILAKQRKDGSLGGRGHDSAQPLMELAELGAGPDRPEVRRAVEAMLLELRETKWIRGAEALCMLGVTEPPEVRATLEDALSREEKWNGPWKLCPWGPSMYARSLWAGRELVDCREAVRRALTWMADGLNDAGCQTYKDPWGFVWVAAVVDMPEARRLVEKLVPLILRGQRDDGGWGDEEHGAWSRNSLKVFRALVRHGLLEGLRAKPPLPRDWKIVRHIPAPEGDLSGLAFGGGRFCILDAKAKAVIGLSPDDGIEAKRLAVPFEGATGLGWWNGSLVIGREEPTRVAALDPGTGEVTRELPVKGGSWVNGLAAVGDELWVGDDYAGGAWRLKPDGQDKDAKPRHLTLAGPAPHHLAAVGDGVWHVDGFAPLLIRSDLGGKLVDWGEKPFEGVSGLAHDGKNLWALDNKKKRICLIEKTSTAPRVYRGATGLRDELYELMNGLDKAQELEWGRVFGRDAEGRAEELARLSGGHGCTQVVDDDGTILWLNAGGRIEVAFSYLPEAGDLEAFRDIYRRIERTDSPLTFVVFPQPGRKDTFDAHRLSRKSYLEHSWELGIKAKAEALPLAQGIRKDLHDMFRTPADEPTSPLSRDERRYWGWRLSHSDAKVIARLERDAARYGCAQSVDGKCILWKDAGGSPAVMFRVVRDPRDPKVFRRLYDRLIRERIPLAYCFVNQLPDADGDWDVWSMSRQRAQTHCWRFWAHDARPEPDEEEGPADGTF